MERRAAATVRREACCIEGGLVRFLRKIKEKEPGVRDDLKYLVGEH